VAVKPADGALVGITVGRLRNLVLVARGAL